MLNLTQIIILLCPCQ